MRIIILFISAIFLTACAQQKEASQLEQGQQCWVNAKSQFVAANPNSPALWFLPDNYSPTAKELHSKLKVTPLEKQDLAYLITAYQNCFAPPMQLTGDAKYDDYLRRTYNSKFISGDDKQDALLRTTYASNFMTLIDIIQYMNGSIDRGEYYRRYVALKSKFDTESQQELAAIRAEDAAEYSYPTNISRR